MKIRPSLAHLYPADVPKTCPLFFDPTEYADPLFGVGSATSAGQGAGSLLPDPCRDHGGWGIAFCDGSRALGLGKGHLTNKKPKRGCCEWLQPLFLRGKVALFEKKWALERYLKKSLFF